MSLLQDYSHFRHSQSFFFVSLQPMPKQRYLNTNDLISSDFYSRRLKCCCSIQAAKSRKQRESESMSEQSMLVSAFDSYGPPEVLFVDSWQKPTRGPGEALIKILATSVNPVDCKYRSGKFKAPLLLKLPKCDLLARSSP